MTCQGTPPSITGGSFSCGTSTTAGTSCAGTCNAFWGGSPSVPCLSTGEWGTVTGACTPYGEPRCQCQQLCHEPGSRGTCHCTSCETDCMHQTTQSLSCSAACNCAICLVLWSSACQPSTVATGSHHHGVMPAAAAVLFNSFKPQFSMAAAWGHP